jgi:hypothetical protein
MNRKDKQALVILALGVLAAGAFWVLVAGAFHVLRDWGGPPSKIEVTRRFHQNKPTYEQLRSMLLEDKTIDEVAPFGVETRLALGPAPNNAGMPPERYNAYMALLSRIGARAVIRADGRICVLLWRAGLGDSIHLDVCRLDAQGGNRPKDPYHDHQFYPLGDRWYIQTDWGHDRLGY